MKKLTLVFLLVSGIVLGDKAFAQGKYGSGPDSVKCVTNLSFYSEYVKAKQLDEALPSWRNAYKYCPPTASQQMLIDGTTLLRRLVNKNARNPEYRKALVDSIMTLHDTRVQYYPKYAVRALNTKGQDLHSFVKDNPQMLFDGYEGIVENNQEQVLPTILLYDLQAAVNLYQDGKIDAEKVINVYQRNTEIFEKINVADADKEQMANIKNDMGSLFASSKVADCETLIELYTPRLAADPENLQLAQSIAKTMRMAENCDGNDLFLQAVTLMNKKDPSSSTSYYLYRLHGARGNVKEAISYIESALAGEDVDAATKADWTFDAAKFCFKNGENARAFEFASKAAETESLAGKAYFLMGNIWAAVRCGGDEVAKRAQYWVACDYMNKAKAADPSLTDEANRYISQYSVYFPAGEDAFMYDVVKGQSYTVVCGGLRATTTVRLR